MQNNKSMVYWMLGDYYNAQRINYELMNVIKPHPESYPEAITIAVSYTHLDVYKRQVLP